MPIDPDPHAAARSMARLFDAATQTPLTAPEHRTVDGRTFTPAEVLRVLAPRMTEERLARIDAVLAGRTYQVVPVVEGLVNTGNVSAVMRSAEALGYQGFHVVTGDAEYKRSQRTSQGADKWLDVWHWPDVDAAADHLQGQGYRLVATHLDDAAVPIDQIDFTEKTALVFGNERDGVSERLLARADARCIIPTTGFVQSFNISVAAATALYHARQDRRARQGRHGDLTEAEQAALRAVFCLRSVRHPEQLLRRAMQDGTV